MQTACHHAHVADRQDSDREVLTSLPRSRPVRRSAKRGDRAVAKTGAKAPTTRGAKRSPSARAANPATKARSATPKARRATSTPKARNAKPAPNAPAKALSGVGAVAGAAAPKQAAPKAAARPRTAPRRKVAPAGYATPAARAQDSSGSGAADLLGTTIQAVAELAQIGMTVGRQTLQSMIDRLPKP